MENENKYLKMFDDFKQRDDNVYVYVRVSTNMQSIDNQLLEVYNYCEKERIYPPKKNIYYDEGISGYKVSWKDRKIYDVITKCKKNDIIILPELSRAGRNMYEVNEIIAHCKNNNITLIDVKNKIKFDGQLHSAILGQLYGMFSLIERNLISERVKNGMAKAKLEGKLKGRKRCVKKNKLDDKHEEIKEIMKEDISLREKAKKLDVDHTQLKKYINKHNL